MNVRRELRRVHAPDEPGAQTRAWKVVSSSYLAGATRPRRARRYRLAVAPVAAAVVLAVVLTPAGATVSRVISHAVAPPPAEPMLSLPSHGKLLVSSVGGTWIVAPDGTRSRVGSWRQANWSPHARYIVVASRNKLAAVTQGGEIKWELSRRAVSDPSWFAPSGFRIAYRSGSSLRVVAGDGTGDRLLARHVAPVAPVWRPDHPYQLAYIHNGHVVLRDADSGQLLWTKPAGSTIKLQWSANGSRLLLLTRTRARMLSANGQTQTTIKLRTSDPLINGSLSPDGTTIALVRRQGVQIAHLAAGSPARDARLASALPGTGARQVTWSPDSRWLLVSWPAANEWVFLATGQNPRLKATSRIAQRFGQPATNRLPHRSHKTQLPDLDGWCCVATAATPGHHSPHRIARPVKASTAAARPKTWSQRLQASRQALIDELAPLRRPQTADERAFAEKLKPDEAPYYYINETIDRSLVRYATTTPWGERIYLVPVAPWSPRRINCCGGSGHLPPVEGIVAYSKQDGFLSYSNAARIQRYGSGVDTGTFSHGALTSSRSISIVPDGITKVGWTLPRQPGGSEYGWPTYPHVGHLKITVDGNIAAAESPRFGQGQVEIWYAASGHILRRFGSIAAARRVVPVTGPAPETPRSQAAERNPATPNPVSVTPTTGGPNTPFTLHFRALLNNAVYGFRITGTKCRDVLFASGYHTEGNPAGNLRGDRINAQLVAHNHALCPGTYRVSVKVNGLGPIGPWEGRRIAAKPFGAATFTVH